MFPVVRCFTWKPELVPNTLWMTVDLAPCEKKLTNIVLYKNPFLGQFFNVSLQINIFLSFLFNSNSLS